MIFTDRNGPLNILLFGSVDADIREIRESLEQAEVVGRLHTVGKIGDAVAYLRREPPYTTAPIPDVVLGQCANAGDCPCGLANEIQSNGDLSRTELFVLASGKQSRESESGQLQPCGQPQLGLHEFVDAVQRVEMDTTG